MDSNIQPDSVWKSLRLVYQLWLRKDFQHYRDYPRNVTLSITRLNTISLSDSHSIFTLLGLDFNHEFQIATCSVEFVVQEFSVAG